MKLIRISVVVLVLSASTLAAAQAPHQGGIAPPQLGNPAQGMLNENQDQPIQIDAATLEVRDKEKMATFSGEVQVVADRADGDDAVVVVDAVGDVEIAAVRR